MLASGGLPGIEGKNELWVLHGDAPRANAGGLPTQNTQPTANNINSRPHSVRIPLLLTPGEPLPFSERDIVLEDGDILHVRSRDDEVFYVGGLLNGGQFPLPQDTDLDVLEAIATVTGSPGGYPATKNFPPFSSGLGGIVKPTRVIVVRTLPNNEEIKIAVDLSRAAAHRESRLIVQPDDFILLEYKPSEFIANAALSLIRPNIAFISTSINTNNAAVATNNITNQTQNNPEPAGGALGP
jgi:hypothetical protein